MANKQRRGLRENREHTQILKSKRLAIIIVGVVTLIVFAIAWSQRDKIVDTVGPKIGLVHNHHKKNLQKDWRNTLKGKSVNVDIAVYNNKTDKLIQTRHSNTDTFSTASAIKVSVLAELLSEHQESDTPLTDNEQALATNMIQASDNDSTTSLLYQMGGYQAPDNVFDKLGMNDSKMNTAAWGDSKTTAPDQIKLLRNIFYQSKVLNGDSQQYAQKLMSNIEKDQSWGVSAGVPKKADIALKNGWLPDDDGSWIVNSLGHVKNKKVDYVIAVLTNGDETQQSGINLIEKLSRQTYKELAN